MTHAAYRSTDAEVTALRAMGLKLPRDYGARAAPKAEPPEPEPELIYYDISRDVRSQAASRGDCIDAANHALVVALTCLKTKLADIDTRFTDATAKVATLEGSVRELTGQVGDLTHEVARLKAARGVSDGQALAGTLPVVRRRAPPKKANGSAAHA